MQPVRWPVLMMAVAGLGGACAGSSEAPTGEQTELEGRLVVRAAHHEGGVSSYEYALETDDGIEQSLSFEHDPQLAPGERVRLAVHLLDDRHYAVDAVAESSDTAGTRQPLITPQDEVTGRVAVLMVQMHGPDETTPAKLRQSLFTATKSARDYFEENSYGSHHMEGDVFGWYAIPDPQGCDPAAIGKAARAAASAAGVDLSSYRQLVYYMPNNSGCAWGVLAELGQAGSPARDSWLNGMRLGQVLPHVLAENHGAYHARSCTSVDATGNCAGASEYGDSFDPMGTGFMHLNAVHKIRMGWFGGCNVVSTSVNGTVELAPIELPSDQPQVLRIPRANGRYYYVESRTIAGNYDVAIADPLRKTVYSGVLIHEGPDWQAAASGPLNSHLLDATPVTSSFNDAALMVGKTFVTPEGYRISLIAKSATKATLRIRLPAQGQGAICLDGTPIVL